MDPDLPAPLDALVAARIRSDEDTPPISDRSVAIVADALRGRHRRSMERVGDEEIVKRLARYGFDRSSRAWTCFAEAMVEYGYSVFVGWLVAGTVYNRASNLGHSGVRGLSRVPRDLQLREEDAHDLAVLLVETAILRFHATLRDGGWRADGGASLSTFFVGRCLMELPDVYERWNRQRVRWLREVAAPGDAVDEPSHRTDPADAAVTAVLLDEVLAGTGQEHARTMFELVESGYTMADIAAMFRRAGFEYSDAAIRTRIARARARAREAARDEEPR